MKIITFNDIKNLNITPIQAFQWTVEMIENKNLAELPAKISLKPQEGVFCNIMPCILPHKSLGNVGGVKIVTRYPNRVPSLDSKLLLLNADNGEFLALMDANWITAMRTGAVAAHSIKLFGKTNFSKIGILGLGNTARATLLILSQVITDRILYIKLLKYKGQEHIFEKRFSNINNFQFEYVDNYEDLVRGTDVLISCATYFNQDICRNENFDEGVLVIPVHTKGFSNCDLFFDKVYADDYSHVHHFNNFDKFRSFAEVSDVIQGKSVGRENDHERIIVYNIGVAIHDVNFAAHIYQKMNENINLQNIDMLEPKEKFWI